MSMLGIEKKGDYADFFRKLDIEKEKRMKENSELIGRVEIILKDKTIDEIKENKENIVELTEYIDAITNEDYYNTYYMLWILFDVDSFNDSLNEVEDKDKLYNYLQMHVEKPDVIPTGSVCISYWMDIQSLNDYMEPFLKFKDIEFSSMISDGDYTRLKGILSALNTKFDTFVLNNVRTKNT